MMQEAGSTAARNLKSTAHPSPDLHNCKSILTFSFPHKKMATTTYPPVTHGGTVTSWIPLTTAFPYSQGCESCFWSYVQSTLAAWDPGVGISADTNLHCVPPAVTTWWDQDRLGDLLTTTSIGPLTCPESFTTGATSVENGISTWIACCPP